MLKNRTFPLILIRNLLLSRGIFIILILLLSLSFISCIKQDECKERNVEPFRVKQLKDPMKVIIGDNSLAGWESSYIVMQVTSTRGVAPQWAIIRKDQPHLLNDGDIDLKVYMAHDGSYWYIAIDALDDKILSVDPDYEHPYSGDSVEIFFAGKKLDSTIDINGHVEAPDFSNQAAFFQLIIPAKPLRDKSFYFPKYRTDLYLKKIFLRSESIVSIWSEGEHRWKAEVRIPLKNSFEPMVVNRINGHETLKMNIDYLDYDNRLAERSEEDNWGFRPNNVYCLDDDEDRVNTPKCMRPVIFE